MKIVLQRVSDASIVINGNEPKRMDKGLVALVGMTHGDDQETADYMLNKLLNLRIFEDQQGAMNLSLLDIKAELLIVPNFTLYANSRRGRRPSFTDAAAPKEAAPLFDYMVEQAATKAEIVSGEFGANMQIDLCNDGPVTIILDSEEIMPKG